VERPSSSHERSAHGSHPHLALAGRMRRCRFHQQARIAAPMGRKDLIASRHKEVTMVIHYRIEPAASPANKA